ncbi:MAG: hypothetical protein O3A74_03365 [archaeon]|nr:hypothetical protein [archaeon]MDA0842827.1 hypothetical protein [archaeon]
MRREVSIFLLSLLISSVFISLSAFAAEGDIRYDAGFEEWDIVAMERLFVEGDDVDSAVLQRGQTDSAVGGFVVSVTGGPVPVFSLESPPVYESIDTNVQMSVFFSMILQTNSGPTSCTRQTFTDSSTSLFYTVRVAGQEVYQEEVTETIDKVTQNDAMNFSGAFQNVSLVMEPGDTITLDVSVHHRCVGTTARIQWGGFEFNSGGIIMEGVMYQPEASIFVDEARRAHIQIEQNLPFGPEDLRDQKWEIWGPLDKDEKFTNDGDLLVETSANRIQMYRQLGNNTTVSTWSGAEKLPLGDLNLQICIRSIAGDLNSDCHAFGILRFEVEERYDGFANATLLLSIATTLSFFGFVWNAYRQHLLLPLPILGALVVLLLSIIMGPVLTQYNLDGIPPQQYTPQLTDVWLEDTNGSEVSLGELYNGKNLLLVAIVLPGSENIFDHANEFNTTLDTYASDIEVIHVIMGEDATQFDVELLEQSINASWSVYLDSASAFESLSPGGLSDHVLLVDAAGIVSYSSTPTAGAKDIADAIDAVESGGSQPIAPMFGVIFGSALFLIFLALPREGWEAPEEPLPPGLLWISIIIAGAVGVLLVNLPMLLLVLLPLPWSIGYFGQILMMVWFLEMALVTARKGSPYEADIVGKALHSLFPQVFQKWRDVVDMQRDVLLGVWAGWMTWFVYPMWFQQGVGATALMGGASIGMALFLFGVYLLFAGLAILCLRFVASWGGPFSRLFGRFGSEVFAQFVGWALVPVALWALLNTFFSLSNIGIF